MNKKKSLRVLVVFEFEGIEDPDSNEADAIVESLVHKCDRFCAEAGAHSAWVEEMYGADKEEVSEVERLRKALEGLLNACPVEYNFHGEVADSDLDAALNAARAALRQEV